MFSFEGLFWLVLGNLALAILFFIWIKGSEND